MFPRKIIIATTTGLSVLFGSTLVAQTTEPPAPDAEVEVPADAPPTTALQDLAADDPNLEMVEGEDGEADEMVMLADVLFGFGSATLSDSAKASLANVADVIGEYAMVELYGHTDAIGSESANLALGQRRAEAVRAFLLEISDLDPETLVAKSAGEGEPVADNLNDDGSDNPEGRALNRRVVFKFPDA